MRWRRVVPFAGFALAGLAVGFGLSFTIPPRYRASAVVVVSVAGLDPGRTSSRLSVVESEVLSALPLEAVAAELEPYPALEEPGRSSLSAVAERLRDDVDIVARGGQAFEVRYAHTDPATAHDVVNGLVVSLVDGQAERLDQGERPGAETEPIDPELVEMKRRIAETQARIDSMGQRSPPGPRVENLRSLQLELKALQAQVQLAEARVRELRAALDAPPPSSPPAIVPSPVEELRGELAALRARYTDQHPDVQKLLASLQRAEALEGRPAPSRDRVSDRAELLAAEQELEQLKQRRRRAALAADRGQAEMARASRVDDEIARLTRENRRLQERYVARLAERTASGTQTMQKAAPTLRFSLESPARWPREPFSPKRGLYAMLGLLGGIVLGVLASLISVRLDDRIHDAADVESLLRAPQLASIPEVRVSRRDRHRQRRATATR